MTSLPATTIELTQVEAASRIQQAYRHYLVKKQQNKNLDFVKSLVKGSSIGVHRTLDKASWLEANDPKHRYGQHLAPYHAAWIATGSNENFYTWLDEGEGKEVSTEKCPRAALDEGQVEVITPSSSFILSLSPSFFLCLRHSSCIYSLSLSLYVYSIVMRLHVSSTT